jgi:hypothetical protein
MSLNPRNLVVVCIDGRTMRNLATNGLESGSVPVEGAFDLIHHLVTKCVGVDNVCVVFTNIDTLERKQAIDAWLTDHKFFKGTGLSYRVRNIAYPSPTDGPETMAEYVSEFLVKRHGHILVISDCWSTFHGFRSDTKKSVTRVLLNPTPEEESRYQYSLGSFMLREWNDIRVQLPEFLRL